MRGQANLFLFCSRKHLLSQSERFSAHPGPGRPFVMVNQALTVARANLKMGSLRVNDIVHREWVQRYI